MAWRIALLACVLAALGPCVARAQSDERCFAETGFCIDGAIRGYWERNGGLEVFGYPLSSRQTETVEGHVLVVQWFERDRLEIQADGLVTAGRLGARYLEVAGRPWKPGERRVEQSGCR